MQLKINLMPQHFIVSFFRVSRQWVDSWRATVTRVIAHLHTVRGIVGSRNVKSRRTSRASQPAGGSACPIITRGGAACKRHFSRSSCGTWNLCLTCATMWPHGSRPHREVDRVVIASRVQANEKTTSKRTESPGRTHSQTRHTDRQDGLGVDSEFTSDCDWASLLRRYIYILLRKCG